MTSLIHLVYVLVFSLVHVKTQKEFPEECHKALDLGFLMDSSYTISPSLWEEQKSIVMNLLDKMNVSPSGTHLSVMSFSTDVEFPIPFNGYKDIDDLKRKVTQLSYHTGWSRTDLGLTAVKERMFDKRFGARDVGLVPRALLLFTNDKTDGSSDQNVNWTQVVSEAADEVKHAQIKIFCVKIGEAVLQDKASIASDTSLVFSQLNIDGMLKALNDLSAEACSNGDLPAVNYPSSPSAEQVVQYPVAAAVPAGACQIPQCTYPSICITAMIYQTCVAPTSSKSSSGTCASPGSCLTTQTITATDTATTTATKTQTDVVTSTKHKNVTSTVVETSTAMATSTAVVTATTTSTNTATSTEVATSTQVNTSTSTLTTTSTGVTTSTLVTTLTRTTTKTEVVTSTSQKNTTSTAVKTSHAVATSTAVVTATTTSTDTATSTQIKTATSTLTTTSTGVATSTLFATATHTNTFNTTQFATETSTKTINTTATHNTTVTHNATSFITATATSSAIATSTAVLTATSTAKITETLTTTSTAIQTKTLTNTLNHTLTRTQTLTTTSTSVVTSCSANCSKIEPSRSLSTIRSAPSIVTQQIESCSVNYNKLGCFVDDRINPRPLPELLFTDGDPGSKVHSGQRVNWDNWNSYLVDIVCRCAKAAKAKRYTHFAIQFYVECWSGPEASLTFTRAGNTNQCVTMDFKECNPADKRECAGKLNTNFVYEMGVQAPPDKKLAPSALTPSTTPSSIAHCINIIYERVGCFTDKQVNDSNLALPEMLVNQTNTIIWDKWNEWLSQFLCRCAEEVSKTKYEIFGIHNYGECWSGTTAPKTYNKYGPSKRCIRSDFKQCEISGAKECAGEQSSNYVYRIVKPQASQEGFMQPPGTAAKQVETTAALYGNCAVDFKKEGCFNNLRNSRRLRELMFTDLDQNAVKYSGFPVDWGKFDAYLNDVACRCAQVSKAKGFTYFGIADFGECWSGKGAGKTIDREDSSRFCITKEFAQCDENDQNICSGNKTTTFVYSIPENYEPQQETTCFTQFENVGCYADKQLSPRPIPDLIFSDLDKESPKYSGNEARLGELDAYLSDVLCRCAEQTQELGYIFFGVQNHGECYSGPDSRITYNKDGPSDQCITRDFKQCHAGSHDKKENPKACVGAQGANYVYRISGTAN
ncbi:uncharacterized protein LOC114963020 isoform X2 [Acropora millepora]|uniref:uncharacterized protein LOC114963020 isoform X2 n=1 Tax=Acropora millepora TaxID=45264 RepID=UPI001CF2D444|nr:uncharacterized protein LOC114963020 isoform X2 [Acropora millepora]